MKKMRVICKILKDKYISDLSTDLSTLINKLSTFMNIVVNIAESRCQYLLPDFLYTFKKRS